MIFDMRVYFLFIYFSLFYLYESRFVTTTFAHLNAMELRKLAIEMTVSIKYMLIESFKGFKWHSLLGIDK